jgi:hypothetical protein
MQTKNCTKCREERPLLEFRKQKDGKHGVTSHCKICDKKYYQENKESIKLKSKNYCLEYPEKKKESDRKYYQSHKEQSRISRKKWRDEHKEENKNRNLQLNYGITLEEYRKLFQEQNGVCAICGKLELIKWKSLSVDHNHSTNKVRGLLCNHCNTGLGKFKDNIITLEKAIEYLKLKG